MNSDDISKDPKKSGKGVVEISSHPNLNEYLQAQRVDTFQLFIIKLDTFESQSETLIIY